MSANSNEFLANLPYIPEFITVHLGAPSSYAANVTVTFPEYIKNVASSEIYPTWPENALRANIYAQISFALNRVYTEYYRSRGYDFDITNNTGVDQSFVNGRDIFENISQIVDEIFNNYIQRQGSVEPLFAQYCNGTTTICDGLSQWGSVELANQGYTPYEILTYYYGEDINIVTDAPVRGITVSVPYRALRIGSGGDDVKTVQIRLNRISTNYPSIPKIIVTNGIFDVNTEEAVREFQRIFNLTADGIVGKATWYKIMYVYNAVKRIDNLNSEGITLEEVAQSDPDYLAIGASGDGVRTVQYLLAYIAQYETSINPIPITGYFDDQTRAAVIAFQQTYGLEPTGVIDSEMYVRMYDVYRGILVSLPESMFTSIARPYPGYILTLGMNNPDVTYLQEYLNAIAAVYPEIPTLEVNGVFDEATRDAVYTFQSLFGLPVTGYVAYGTWNAIAELYDDIRAGTDLNPGQYPGYELRQEE